MSENKFSEEEGTQLRSAIACHVCRKRKVKCGRETPQCSLCQQSLQVCEYARKPLRPGPKIGSTQNPRKRKNRTADGEEDQTQERTRQPTSPAQQIRSDNSNTTSTRIPNSQDVSEAPESPARQADDIQALSFIIHPSHESCSSEKGKDDSPGSNSHSHSQQGSHVSASCYALGFSPVLLDHFIDRFFENFTSFQLFRPADLRPSLHSIESANQCQALLAVILLFATKHQDDEDDAMHEQPPQNLSSSHLLAQAHKLVDHSFYECEDSPISLPLLQAVILLTHWLLIQGVRGRAWRYLRVAVGSAYELNMHLIDRNKRSDDKVDADLWCEEEGRRRAWWAIWEMDVFASVIRRCPTGIDWSQNETFLPAEDENWFRGQPQKSCTLRQDFIEKYKFLEASGNESAKAWFIVVNSLMKEAQKITSPIGVDKDVPSRGHYSTKPLYMPADDSIRNSPSCKESLNRLLMIYNALQCTSMTLPRSLRYRHQNLSFGSRELDPQSAQTCRLQHSDVYSIHCMVQLTKLMISKYYLFNNDLGALSKKDPRRSTAMTQALERYSEASDEIVSLVGRSYEEHYKFVNPFVANTIWLAGAVQLLYRELASLDKSDRDFTNSKLELLSVTYNRFVRHWNMSSTLQKNLEVVQSEISNLQSKAQKGKHGSKTRRPSVAKSRSSNASTAGAVTNNAGCAETQNTSKHKKMFQALIRLPPTDAESFLAATVQVMKDPASVEKRPWHGIPEKGNTTSRNDFNQDNLAQYGQMDAGLFGNGSAQAPLTKSSDHVHAFLISASTTMAQVPTMTQSMPSNNGICTDGDLAFYPSTSTEAELSPDFYVGSLTGGNPDLSHYFGDILSGGYMA
ncbi:hypothetical protein LTS15_000871 [Exophiala xenobiotica]|nr:hypothetical protein LTS15_000871 [Exophiala xenobiotica]